MSKKIVAKLIMIATIAITTVTLSTTEELDPKTELKETNSFNLNYSVKTSNIQKDNKHKQYLSETENKMKPKKDRKIKYSIGLINVRQKPTTESEILTQLEMNEPVEVYPSENGWNQLVFEDGYIRSDLLNNNKINYEDINVPIKTITKSYMPLSAINSVSSDQYKVKVQAYTGDNGIAVVDGRYCVAMATYYGIEVGQYFDLILENGNVIPCVMCDVKSDAHTDTATHSYTVSNKCGSEFVIASVPQLKLAIGGMGSLSYIDGWNSPVQTVRIYNKSCLS